MTDKSIEQRIIDGSAWADFCDSLKEAGNVILRSETPNDLFNRAEGYRYLTRLLRAGLESNVEFSDPSFPQFFQLADETKKIGNDNPDNFYQNVNINGKYDYSITGTRGTVDYLSLGTKAGSYATTGRMEPTGQINGREMQINADGTFEIIVSSTPKPGKNWLPMTKDSHSIVVRQTFGDRKKETPAIMKIRCLNGEGDNTLEPIPFVKQLENTVKFVKNTATLFVDWMEIYREHLNKLPSDNQERCQVAGGDATIHYLQSFWKLAPDEALLIHARKIPECRTWNFQLSNYWMESLDFRYFRICVNKHTAHYEKDGSVKIVVAHRDPGPKYPNWLTTTNHDQGGMLFRWVEATEHPPVDTEVVKFADL
jgi:hypothetical protein